MAQSYTSGRRIETASVPSGLPALVILAVVGAVGGILMGIGMELSTASDLLGGEYYWSAVLAGNALVLGFGWAMLVLWQLLSPRSTTSALLAAAFSLVAALIGAVVTRLGVELKLSFLVIAALPALLSGLWLAKSFVGASPRQLGICLAVGLAWLLIGLMMALMLAGQPTPNKVPLPESIPLWIGEIVWWLNVPLVLAWPMVAIALARLAGNVGTQARNRRLLYFLVGLLVLPLALAGSFAVTLHLIPD